MALLYAMAMAHRPSSCGGNGMGKKKNAPAEIEKVTITMSRPVAEAVAKPARCTFVCTCVSLMT